MQHPQDPANDDVDMLDGGELAPPMSRPGNLSEESTGAAISGPLTMSPPSPPSVNSGESKSDLTQEAAWRQSYYLADSAFHSEQTWRQILQDELRAEQHGRRISEGLLWDEQCRREAAEKALQTERLQRKACERSLEEERQSRQAAETYLKEKSAESQDFQKRWKQTARELNKIRSQQQGFHLVTDDYLVERINSLRYAIQTFAIQFYGGKAPRFQKPKMAGYFVELLKSVANLESDLMSQDRRANAVQAIIWRELADHVFDKFQWLSTAAGSPAYNLCNVLRPKWQRVGYYTGSRDPAVEQKFQIWSASTTAILMDLDDNQQRSSASNSGAEKLENKGLFQGTLEFFTQIPTTCDPHGLADGFRQIFQEAIDLDKEISRQVARIEWDFQKGHTGMELDLARMTVARDEGGCATTDKVRLVIAPRVIKRGKSTGNDFEVEHQLLPMQVTLMLASENDRGGGKGFIESAKEFIFGN
ncbi:hypothetical protein V8F06_008804 [Rhypophila decipiens]